MKKRGRNRSFSFCNFFLKNRRGSHVGRIISFVIFVTFIVFLYVVVKPVINTGEDKKETLDYLTVTIIKNISANLTSTSVEVNSSVNPPQNCISLESFFVLLSMEIPGYNLIIKNETGSMQNAYTDQAAHLVIDRENKSNRFFRIYYSPEFDVLGSKTDCKLVEDDAYSLSLIKTEKYVFEDRLFGFLNNYKSDYEKLKTDMNFPPGNEFGIGFTQSNGTKMEVGETVSATGIYAEEIPVQYVDNDANILSGFINIKVW